MYYMASVAEKKVYLLKKVRIDNAYSPYYVQFHHQKEVKCKGKLIECNNIGPNLLRPHSHHVYIP